MDETTLPKPADSEPIVEPERSGEQLPSEVSIYAMDRVFTHRHSVSSQGFGISTPLETPRHETTYHWTGRLHKNERSHPDSTGSSSNASSDIETLAINFAENYRNHQNPEQVAKGEPSYTLRFEPSKELMEELVKKNFGAETTFRGLTSEEQERFMDAFRKANEKAVKQQ